MSIAAVLCDLGGVVVDVNADRLVHQVSQVLHRPFDEVQQAVYHPELLVPFELGRISPQDYYAGLRRLLPLPWGYDQFVAAWNGFFLENQDVTGLLARLRPRHRLVALSNTNVLHIGYLRDQLPSLACFHDWVASCEVGLRKPDPEIYRVALARAAVEAPAAVYIDDRPELVEAGQALGLRAIRFESCRQLEAELMKLQAL